MDDLAALSPGLRTVICGDVDAGKSTLIGRLLHDTGQIHDDQMRAISQSVARAGVGDGLVDLSLITDGLQDERDQGITIDVAYRTALVGTRRVLLADVPGHEQYTRNMAVAASTADCAIVLIDARRGVVEQTLRHSRILQLMGVRRVLLAVNKMDAIQWDAPTLQRIGADFRERVRDLGLDVAVLGLCATHGTNVTTSRSADPSVDADGDVSCVLDWLNRQCAQQVCADSPVRAPVQCVTRTAGGQRHYAMTISQGRLRAGSALVAMPSGERVTVKDIRHGSTPVEDASIGQAVSVTFHENRDIARGDVLCDGAHSVEVGSQWRAHIVVVGKDALIAQRSYWLKAHHKTVGARITSIRHIVDPMTGAHLASQSMGMNAIAAVHLSVDEPVVFTPYADNRDLGGFILIDPVTKDTVAAGMVEHGLRRDANISMHAMKVNQAARQASKGQRALCLWLTGLSGSGKSTLASEVEQRMHEAGLHTYVLDGDNVRHGLNRDLGFTPSDRAENVRRIAEVARLMVDAGLIVLVSSISPYRSERALARSLFDAGSFFEVFVDTPLAECERRDPKGLYAKARRGEIPNFTGISSPYESPEQPDLRIDHCSRDAAGDVMRWLRERQHPASSRPDPDLMSTAGSMFGEPQRSILGAP